MSGLLDPPPLLAGDDPQNVDSRQVDVDRAAGEGWRDVNLVMLGA